MPQQINNKKRRRSCQHLMTRSCQHMKTTRTPMSLTPGGVSIKDLARVCFFAAKHVHACLVLAFA